MFGVAHLAAAQLGAQIPGHGQLPLAPVLHADHTAALVMVIAIYAGFAGGVVWALAMLARGREALPLLLLVAGVIAANLEPLGDHVGLIVYAPNIPWFHYWVMGRRMPSFILVGEATYVAFGSYYAYRMLDRGTFRGPGRVHLGGARWHPGDHRRGALAPLGDDRLLRPQPHADPRDPALLDRAELGAAAGVRVHDPARRPLPARPPAAVAAAGVPCVTIGYIVGVSWPVYLAIQSSAAAPITWAACLVTCAASLASCYAVLQSPPVRERRAAAAVPVSSGAAVDEPVAVSVVGG